MDQQIWQATGGLFLSGAASASGYWTYMDRRYIVTPRFQRIIDPWKGIYETANIVTLFTLWNQVNAIEMRFLPVSAGPAIFCSSPVVLYPVVVLLVLCSAGEDLHSLA